jgi:putative hydrolase of the HAD superfamily
MFRPTSIQAVILDVDDTLYAEIDYVHSGFRAVAQHLEAELQLPARETSNEFTAILDAGHRSDTFNRWLADRSLDADKWLPEMLHVYRDHDPDITMSTEHQAVLDRLKQKYALGVVSDGRHTAQQKKVDALGLHRWISTVVLSDRLGREHWKPSTRPFEAVLEQLQVEPARAVYVGDNPKKDFLGPRRMGMQSVRVRRPNGLYANLEPSSSEHRADAEIVDLSALPKLLAINDQAT